MSLKNRRGQATVETILVMAVVIVCWNAAFKGLKKTEFIQKIFGQPWARLVNTIEYGVPLEDKILAERRHPTGAFRHTSPTGQD